MALDKAALASALQEIFEDVPTEGGEEGKSDQMSRIADAISSYLGDAEISNPIALPVNGKSSVNFPAASALSGLLILPPPEACTSVTFPQILGGAMATVTAVSLGNKAGAISPNAPPGSMVMLPEIGLPPIMPALPLLLTAFASNEQTAEDAANNIANAVHTSVTSILFNVINLLNIPPTPVPTPIIGTIT